MDLEKLRIELDKIEKSNRERTFILNETVERLWHIREKLERVLAITGNKDLRMSLLETIANIVRAQEAITAIFPTIRNEDVEAYEKARKVFVGQRHKEER